MMLSEGVAKPISVGTSLWDALLEIRMLLKRVKSTSLHRDGFAASLNNLYCKYNINF